MGVLSNPYRYIEAGQEFEHDTPMKWAEPVDEPKAAKPAKSKKADPAGDEADPI